jgi:2-methylcitrate dehydratase PrpD
MAPAQPLTRQIAERVLAIGPNRVTEKAEFWTKQVIIDTIACALAGLPEPCADILLRAPHLVNAEGPALIWGTDRRTSPLDAALVNGTAAHALDYDDMASLAGTHPSAVMIPALFALAEQTGASGRDLIAAYVAGFEFNVRLSRAINYHHYEKGWHPTATMGTFSTAAAAAHLLKLDVAKTATAIALAGSMASGIKANFGTMTKPLHVGHAARNGVMAALLAQNGFTANHAALEEKQGFFNVYNGPGTYDAEKMLRSWGEPLEIEGTPVGIKQFGCCGSTHSAILMAFKHRADGVKPDDVEKIEVMVQRRRLPHTFNPDPQTPLGAKFSQQYVVARALIDGAVRLSHFEEQAYRDPQVRALMARVDAKPHPEMTDDKSDQFGAEVIITTKDGNRRSHRIDRDVEVWRGLENPMSEAELWEKFKDCGALSLPKDRLAPLFERLQNFEALPNMTVLSGLLDVPAHVRAKPPNNFRAGAETDVLQWVP